MTNKLYKFIGYVPEANLEKVKAALFKAGAGQLEGYSHCSWQVLGLGQFKPLKGANPSIGEIDKIEYVPEWRVETVVPADKLSLVVASYKRTHPYEVPAYEVYEMMKVEF